MAPNGTFIAKIFRGKDVSLLYAQLKIFFSFVVVCKPRSSRNSSIEAFVVCKEYKPPIGYVPTMINPFDYFSNNMKQTNDINGIIVPFIACGDLSAFDSDRNYPASEIVI